MSLIATLSATRIPVVPLNSKRSDDVEWLAPPAMWRWQPPRLARVAQSHRKGCWCPLPSCRAAGLVAEGLVRELVA